MKNNEAFEAYSALKKSLVNDKDVEESLNLFQLYLDELCKSSFSAFPKENYILKCVFSNDFDTKNEDHYLRANILAATASLRRILSYVKEEKISAVLNKMLLDFICDLKPFVIRYDNKQNYDWLRGNINNHITNFYFNLAKSIFFQGAPGTHNEESLVLATSTPFIIRQCIEYKIKRILGIDHITRKGSPDETNAPFYFNALQNNKDYYKTKNIDFEIIAKIHSWTNLYIHGGFRARPWITETALNYLKRLFFEGLTTNSNSDSLYSGIEVDRNMRKSLKHHTSEYIERKLGSDYQIVWLQQPEVAFV